MVYRYNFNINIFLFDYIYISSLNNLLVGGRKSQRVTHIYIEQIITGCLGARHSLLLNKCHYYNIGICHSWFINRYINTYAISAYHPLICEFEPRSWRGELDKIFRKMGTTIILIQIMTLGELLLSCLVTSFSFLSSQILKLFVFPMFWLLLSQTKLITCRNAWCTFH